VFADYFLPRESAMPITVTIGTSSGLYLAESSQQQVILSENGTSPRSQWNVSALPGEGSAAAFAEAGGATVLPTVHSKIQNVYSTSFLQFNQSQPAKNGQYPVWLTAGPYNATTFEIGAMSPTSPMRIQVPNVNPNLFLQTDAVSVFFGPTAMNWVIKRVT
jgi:hypothetical protein